LQAINDAGQMKQKGMLIYEGFEGYRCTLCKGKFNNLIQAEDHSCAKQKQKDAYQSRKAAHRENQGDVMRYMRIILTKRMPRN